MEQTKQIEGFDGKYSISQNGIVYSINYDLPMIWRIDRWGYAMVRLSDRGKKKLYSVHRLVISTFLKPSTKQINHIDGNKLNNNILNLEYCTPQENTKHASKIGLLSKRKKGVRQTDQKQSRIISFV